MAFSFRKILSNIGYFKKDSDSELSLHDACEESAAVTPGKKRRHSAPGTPTSGKSEFKLGEYDTTARKYTTVKRTVANTVLYFSGKSEGILDSRDKSPPPQTVLPDVKKLRLDCYRSPSIHVDASDDEFTFPSRESSPEFLAMAHDDHLEKDILEAMRESPIAAPSKKPDITREPKQDTQQMLNQKLQKMTIMNLASKIKVTANPTELNINDLCHNFKEAKSHFLPRKTPIITEYSEQLCDMQKCIGDMQTIFAKNSNLFEDDCEIVEDGNGHDGKYNFKVQLLSLKSNIDRLLTKHFFDVEVPKKRKQYYANRGRRKRRAKKNEMHEIVNLNVGNKPASIRNKKAKAPKPKCKMSHSSPLGCSDILSSHSILTSSIMKLSLQDNSPTISVPDDSIRLSSFAETVDVSALFRAPPKERIEFYSTVHKIKCKHGIDNEDNVLVETLWLQNDNSEIAALASDLSNKLNLQTDQNFVCKVCRRAVFSNELDLVQHLHTVEHLESLHFVYKVSYINDCIAASVEILPSTVKHPMKLYRDVNKIVCFGNQSYACSLCYLDAILGEDNLIDHVSSAKHIFNMKHLLKR